MFHMRDSYIVSNRSSSASFIISSNYNNSIILCLSSFICFNNYINLHLHVLFFIFDIATNDYLYSSSLLQVMHYQLNTYCFSFYYFQAVLILSFVRLSPFTTISLLYFIQALYISSFYIIYFLPFSSVLLCCTHLARDLTSGISLECLGSSQCCCTYFYRS